MKICFSDVMPRNFDPKTADVTSTVLECTVTEMKRKQKSRKMLSRIPYILQTFKTTYFNPNFTLKNK